MHDLFLFLFQDIFELLYDIFNIFVGFFYPSHSHHYIQDENKNIFLTPPLQSYCHLFHDFFLFTLLFSFYNHTNLVH